MTKEFNEITYSISYHFTSRTINALSVTIIWSSFLLIGAIFFTNLPLLSPIGSIFLLLFIGVIIVQGIRFGLWMYSISRIYWRRFRPPYSEDDFAFMDPSDGSIYQYQPTKSAIRLPLSLLFVASFIIPGIQWIILENPNQIADFVLFIRNIVPQDSIVTLSQISGIPFDQLLDTRGDVQSVVRTLIAIPSFLVLFLVLWSALYVTEMYGLRNFRKLEIENELLQGRLMGSPKEEVLSTAGYIRSFISGLLDSLGDNVVELIRPLVAIFILYLVTLLTAYFQG